MMVKKDVVGIDEDTKGLIIEEVKVGEKIWKIVGVYVYRDMQEKVEKIRDIMERNKEESRLIMGDFNVRTKTKGGRVWEVQGEEVPKTRY